MGVFDFDQFSICRESSIDNDQQPRSADRSKEVNISKVIKLITIFVHAQHYCAIPKMFFTQGQRNCSILVSLSEK